MVAGPVTLNEVKGYAKSGWSFIRRAFTIEVFIFLAVAAACIYIMVTYGAKMPDTIDDERTSELHDVLSTLSEGHGKHRRPKRKRPKVFKMQERCREIFQEIFGRPFPSVRPDFLKNPTTGENLELDGYCESLRIAFEYDGVQHSKYDPYFHKRGAIDFKYQVAKDDYKSRVTKLQGITLVRIPHFIHKNSLKSYILDRLKVMRVEGF